MPLDGLRTSSRNTHQNTGISEKSLKVLQGSPINISSRTDYVVTTLFQSLIRGFGRKNECAWRWKIEISD